MTISCHVLQVKEIIHKRRKCASAQSSEVNKGRRIGSVVEILPGRFQRRKNCQPEEIMAVSNTIMILQQQYNQHNLIKTRLIVIAIEECEEHHGEYVWLPFWLEPHGVQYLEPRGGGGGDGLPPLGGKRRGEYLLHPPYAACLNFRRIKERLNFGGLNFKRISAATH